MKTLSPLGCSDWLRTMRIPEDPYHQQHSPPRHYTQIGLPAPPWLKSAVARRFLSACEPFSAALLQFTDWLPEPTDQMAIVAAVRAAHGEPAPLIQTPGHLFEPAEGELLIGMTALAMFYGWSAYAYFSHGTTLLWWEGEIVDVWSSDDSAFRRLQVVFEDLQLFPTPVDEVH